MSFNLCRGTPISPAPPTFQPRPIEPETNLWCDGLGVFRIFLDSFDDRGPRIRFRDNVLADGVLTGGPHFLNLERTRPPNARNGPASERNIALRGSILLKTYPAPSPDPVEPEAVPVASDDEPPPARPRRARTRPATPPDPPAEAGGRFHLDPDQF